MKKYISMLFAIVLTISLVGSALAKDSDKSVESPLSPQEISTYLEEFKKHKDELIVTNEEPYKEVILDNGYILFAAIREVPVSNTLLQQADPVREIESRNGVKNAVGWVLYEIKFSTRWTYDYDVVKDGYSWVTPGHGLVWALKATSVYGPNKANYNKEWDWTGVGSFAYIIAGAELSSASVTTQHKVKHNGEYSWRFVD